MWVTTQHNTHCPCSATWIILFHGILTDPNNNNCNHNNNNNDNNNIANDTEANNENENTNDRHSDEHNQDENDGSKHCKNITIRITDKSIPRGNDANIHSHMQ